MSRSNGSFLKSAICTWLSGYEPREERPGVVQKEVLLGMVGKGWKDDDTFPQFMEGHGSPSASLMESEK